MGSERTRLSNFQPNLALSQEWLLMGNQFHLESSGHGKHLLKEAGMCFSLAFTHTSEFHLLQPQRTVWPLPPMGILWLLISMPFCLVPADTLFPSSIVSRTLPSHSLTSRSKIVCLRPFWRQETVESGPFLFIKADALKTVESQRIQYVYLHEAVVTDHADHGVSGPLFTLQMTLSVLPQVSCPAGIKRLRIPIPNLNGVFLLSSRITYSCLHGIYAWVS